MARGLNPCEEELTVAGWSVVCSLMSVGEDHNSHETEWSAGVSFQAGE